MHKRGKNLPDDWFAKTQLPELNSGFDEERVTRYFCPSPLMCQSLRDSLMFRCGYQQEWLHVLFILHRPQLENPRERHIPEIRISYKHFREQPPLSGGGVRKTNKTKLSQLLLVAEWVVLRVESRITANVHWLVERAFPLWDDGQTTIIRQRELEQRWKYSNLYKKSFCSYTVLHPLVVLHHIPSASQLPKQLLRRQQVLWLFPSS